MFQLSYWSKPKVGLFQGKSKRHLIRYIGYGGLRFATDNDISDRCSNFFMLRIKYHINHIATNR